MNTCVDVITCCVRTYAAWQYGKYPYTRWCYRGRSKNSAHSKNEARQQAHTVRSLTYRTRNQLIRQNWFTQCSTFSARCSQKCDQYSTNFASLYLRIGTSKRSNIWYRYCFDITFTKSVIFLIKIVMDWEINLPSRHPHLLRMWSKCYIDHILTILDRILYWVSLRLHFNEMFFH